MVKTKSKQYDLEFKKVVVRLSYEGTKTNSTVFYLSSSFI